MTYTDQPFHVFYPIIIDGVVVGNAARLYQKMTVDQYKLLQSNFPDRFAGQALNPVGVAGEMAFESMFVSISESATVEGVIDYSMGSLEPHLVIDNQKIESEEK